MSTLEPGQVTRGRGGDEANDPVEGRAVWTHAWGGDEANDPVEGRAAWAHARGGGSQERQGDDCPEVMVLWQGAVGLPVQAIPPSTRPFLAGSPPLEERSWVPTQAGEKIQLFSSTLERISSSPVKRMLVSPITLEIPTTSSGVDQGERHAPNGLDLQEETVAGDVARMSDEGESTKAHPK